MPTIKPRFSLSTDLWLHPWYWGGMLLLVFLALMTTGIWLLLLNRGWFLQQLPPVPNRPPTADIISIEAAAGEIVVVSIREYIHDPDGTMPRLIECKSPQFGTIERIDDYHFRYSAPPRNIGADLFLYRIADDSGAEDESWVFISGDAQE